MNMVNANELSNLLGVSKSKAYKIIRALNKELAEEGYITISGKCPLSYVEERVFGLKSHQN